MISNIYYWTSNFVIIYSPSFQICTIFTLLQNTEQDIVQIMEVNKVHLWSEMILDTIKFCICIQNIYKKAKKKIWGNLNN